MKKLVKPNGTITKLCFSYIRFSSKIQAKGDSKRRQLEIAPRVAREKGWTLREDLNAQDLGFSAYKGSNLETIQNIIKSANEGKIPKGSVMIIEAFDRLTRLPLDEALQLFRQLLKAGIEIYNDTSGRHITAADLNNPMSIMITVVELDAAHQYSDKLAKRVGDAWKEKRENAANKVIMTRMAPEWLHVDRENNKFTPNKKVKIVERIFNEYASGKSIKMICRELNADKIEPFGKGAQKKKCNGWSSTHLRRLLSSRNVLGEYQPRKSISKSERIPDGEMVPDYYPRIIDNELFYKCQEIMARNKRGGKGTKTNATNLFTGFVKCICGGSMIIQHKPRGNYHYTHLRCSKAINNAGCKHKTAIQYKHVERAVLSVLWSKVIPYMTEDNARADRLAAARGEKQAKEKSIDRYMAVIDATEQDSIVKVSKTIGNKIVALELEVKQLESDIEQLESLSNSNPLTDWTPVEPTAQNRMRLQNILRGEIESLTIDAAARRAKLTLKDPAVTFDLAWNYERANHIRANPADSGFILSDVANGMEPTEFPYQDELWVWRTNKTPQISIVIG